jgi:hypothetical protein
MTGAFKPLGPSARAVFDKAKVEAAVLIVERPRSAICLCPTVPASIIAKPTLLGAGKDRGTISMAASIDTDTACPPLSFLRLSTQACGAGESRQRRRTQKATAASFFASFSAALSL